jgi:glucoamylase
VDPGSGETIGRGWPLLTGERGEYELAAGMHAQERLDTMARSADDSPYLLPEQVWDNRPPSAAGSPVEPGEPTFSATPPAWTHAGSSGWPTPSTPADRSTPPTRWPAGTGRRSAGQDLS